MKFNYTTNNIWVMFSILVIWVVLWITLLWAAIIINWKAAALSGLSIWVLNWAEFRGKDPGMIRKVCQRCKSPEIHADANADWNETTQQWELGTVMAVDGFCDTCDDGCVIEELEINLP